MSWTDHLKSEPRNWTLVVPAGTAVQYESPTCGGAFGPTMFSVRQVRPPSRLYSVSLQAPAALMNELVGAGWAKLTVPPGMVTRRRSDGMIVNGSAGLTETLSQCHVLARQLPSQPSSTAGVPASPPHGLSG